MKAQWNPPIVNHIKESRSSNSITAILFDIHNFIRLFGSSWFRFLSGLWYFAHTGHVHHQPLTTNLRWIRHDVFLNFTPLCYRKPNSPTRIRNEFRWIDCNESVMKKKSWKWGRATSPTQPNISRTNTSIKKPAKMIDSFAIDLYE